MGIFDKQAQGKHAPNAQASNESLTDAPTEMLSSISVGDADKTEAIPADAAATMQSTAVMPKVQDDVFTQVSAGDGPTDFGAINAPYSQDASTQKQARRRGAKAFGITFGVLAALLIAAYVGVALMFSGQFLPNTWVDGHDISMKKDAEAAEILKAIPESYELDVTGGDYSQHLTGEDIGMKLDVDELIKAMHEDQNPWYWPWYVTETNHDETFLLKTTYDKDACNDLVKKAVREFNKGAKAPVDASVYFNEITNTFEIKPDEIGTQLRIKSVQKVVRAAIEERQDKVKLTDKQLLQPSLRADDEKIVNSVEMANGLISTHLTLKIQGNVIDEVANETFAQFVRINDDFEVTLSEDDLAVWVEQLAASYDTIGMTRNYTRPDGKAVTVTGGSYGWEVDKPLLRSMIMDAIKAGGESEIEIPCIDSANMYAGRGERDWGNRYVDVDLAEQHARFYGSDGNIIWEADFISGTPDGDHETPEGVWYIITKQSPSKLIGYLEDGKTKDYEVDVRYWMAFVGNDVGFHDADWQPAFGDDMYAEGYGSHGCINLSTSEAKALYDIIEPNDVVVVHY